MTLLARGQAMLNRQMQVAGGVTVSYRRGATVLSLTVVVGRTAFAQTAPNPGGASLIWGDRDYLILAADLTLGEPAEGDRITEVIGTTECVFECMKPDTGEPAYRYSDQDRTVWRIHVKQVA